MQKITPFLWFDNQAEEAINFYVSVFNKAKMVHANRDPAGNLFTATFQLEGQEFMALNGGPEFHFTPAVSFFVNCETAVQVDELWQKLSKDGSVLMPLDAYPFSEKFGWVADKYGVSWQLNLGGFSQKIMPFLMFVGAQHGKAEEAIHLYMSLFEDSRILNIEHYAEEGGGVADTVKQATFTLNDQAFMAIDSSFEHGFTFTEATSFFVGCKSQAEVDVLWEKLLEGGEAQACGWLKDKFGVSWQIIPSALMEMLADEDAEKAKRVTEAMLQMVKIDIPTLQRAYDAAS